MSSATAAATGSETVALLADIFCRFDELAARHGLEKIKTTGDGYMLAGAPNDAAWQRFCAALQWPELGQDARFLGNAARVEQRGTAACAEGRSRGGSGWWKDSRHWWRKLSLHSRGSF